ncbi:MAG: M1 family metallopeptidase [Bacteroidia bacterium]|nr:M1 family metallopeptidase [Bacteroidia bacterium]
MHPIKFFSTLIIGSLISVHLMAQDSETGKIDVLDYKVQIEPDFSDQSIRGSVEITLKVPPDIDQFSLQSGKLTVARVEGKSVIGTKQAEGKAIIFFERQNREIHKFKLLYHGHPKRGLIFHEEGQKLYTAFFTNEWMPCHDVPDDKATFSIDLIVPNSFTTVASGSLTDSNSEIAGSKVRYSWKQTYPSPPYTYGFAIGRFNLAKDSIQGTKLHYYSEKYSPKELQRIFNLTGDMLSFFEEKSGMAFPQACYSQVMMGKHYQEMSGFAMLKESYGELLLKDSTENHLISHELAHQWWGNSLTCKNWKHFWLNEGFATYMSAAYNEHRFGKTQYDKDINNYRRLYEQIKSKGGDKALVFPDWDHPSKDDRNLVYFKGAYVLHLLREKLGDEAFWKGIKHYSKSYHRKAVSTEDFQMAMEEASGKSLTAFFNRWIY